MRKPARKPVGRPRKFRTVTHVLIPMPPYQKAILVRKAKKAKMDVSQYVRVKLGLGKK